MLIFVALMATAPLQIHLAQRSLVDGYFAFWAILAAWCIWERLQPAGSRRWLVGYGLSLFILVLTKENAAFVVVALICVLGVFFTLRFARIDLPLLLVTVAGPVVALIVLAALVGGIGEWIAFYKMFVAKSQMADYAVRLQDGTWYRYLTDFTLLSPCIVALVFGRIFQIGRDAKSDIFWALFLGFSYVFMSSISYGASLRFAAYWDVPLRWLAASQLILLANRFVRVPKGVVLAVVLVLIATVDLAQYWRYFVHGGIYDPVSFQLLHASRLIK
jgi:4-amino-4-deoxy-L-arabinose transferase-like glycosyltransferase